MDKGTNARAYYLINRCSNTTRAAQSAVCWVPLGATGAAFCPGLARFGKRNSLKLLINQDCTVNSHAGGHRFETGRSHFESIAYTPTSLRLCSFLVQGDT